MNAQLSLFGDRYCVSCKPALTILETPDEAQECIGCRVARDGDALEAAWRAMQKGAA